MGTSIERFLAETGGDKPRSTTGADAFARGEADTSRLKLSLQHGSPANADRTARVMSLEQRTKLGPDLIERNLEEVERRSPPLQSWQLAKLQRENPALASWLAEHPNNASVAGDDIPKLSLIEKLFVGLAGPRNMAPAFTAVLGRRAGARESEQARIGYEAIRRGSLDEPSRVRLEQIEREIGTGAEGKDFLTRVLYGGAKIYGQMAETAPMAATAGLVGAGSGAIGGALGGGVGAVLGGTFGLAAGLATYAYQVEAGHAYLGLSRMRDANGIGIDEESKRNIALTVGAFNGLLESAGVGFIAAPFRMAAKKLMQQSVKDALERPTMRAALNDVGRSYTMALAGETGTEAWQEINNIVGEEIAKMGSAGEFETLLESPEEREKAIRRIADIVQQTAEGMILVAAPGASIHGATSAYQARKATQREQFYLALGQHVSESKTFERLPDAVQGIVLRATKDGPIETVYAPVETFDTYFQSAKLDPRAVAQELGVEKEWDEAHATGGDIAIPIATYATKLAPTEHNAFFAKELRARPNEMNAREAAEYQDKAKQETEELEDTPEFKASKAASDQIEATVTEQLVAAGYDPSTAATNAQQVAAFFRTQGARAGLDPLEYFRSLNFSVTRPEMAGPAPLGAKISLKDVAARAIAFREGQAEQRAERTAVQTEETADPYVEGKREMRDAGTKTADGQFVFARTNAGSLRGNLSTVSTEGLIDELAYIFEQQAQDANQTAPTTVGQEGSGVGFTSVWTGRKMGAAKALGRMASRQKSITRIEAELERRGVADADEQLYKRMTGEEASFDPSTFQQAPRSPAIDRFVALRGAELDPNASPAVREEAGKRAADIEAQARAEYQAAIDAANAAYVAKHGEEAARVFHQSAFHGSPHIFDKFSLHKIGTGEGAQSYGWGLYFAGKKDVAEYYRQALSGRHHRIIRSDGVGISLEAAFRELKQHILERLPGVDFTKAGWAANTILDTDVAWDDRALPLDEFVAKHGYSKDREALRIGLEYVQGWTLQRQQGRLYKVEIPEDDTFLEWDKNIGDQSTFVQERLREAGLLKESGFLGRNRSGREFYQSLGSQLQDEGKTLSPRMGADEAASRHLASLGINGIRYLDQGSRVSHNFIVRVTDGEETSASAYPTRAAADAAADAARAASSTARVEVADESSRSTFNYVVFDDELVSIVEFEQAMPGGDRPRGQISFKVGDQPAVSIQLLADADLSTFLHESGHFYLEVMRDLASRPDASVDITTDFETIKTWLNWQDGQNAFTREQHEKWARGFEAYLMEGKAPSSELRGAFARYRARLVGLYRSFETLQVFLSDDVRQVMDRMLASEDEIAAAQREQKMVPLFADPAAAGMTEKQATRYRDAVLGARTTAENQLMARLMADMRREQDAVYNAERAKVRVEIAEEVNEERDSAAFAFLSRGTMPDGSLLPVELEVAKLSKQALEAEYLGRYPNLMARLRSRFLYSKEGGVHPDQVAEWFGYASGDELIQALLSYEGTPRQRIERLTDERMRADDPNLLTPAELPIEAMKATHNEERAKVLMLELEHLASGNLPALKGLIRRISRRIPPLEETRAQAENIIRNKRVRDINPLLYQRAEEKAARMSVDALLKGDVEAAFDEKLRETLNHELYRAATKAKEEVERVATDLARFGKSAVRERLGKSGGDYLEQIDAILDRFDFRKSVSGRQVERRRSLLAWYEEQVAQGNAPLIPQKLLDEGYRTHYKELTLTELRDIYHGVLSIEKLASLKGNLMASARARALEEARTEIVDSIGLHHDLKTKPQGHPPKTLGTRLAKGAKRGLAEHTRMEFLFDYLDGFKGLGVVWQYLFKPFADAETAENEMRANDAKVMQEIFGVYTAKEQAEWFTRKVYIPVARSSKHDGNFTKATILAAALNWGNDYNRDALMQGYDWTLSQVEAVLEQLDGKDWITVQRIWDHIESYWPQVEQLEKDLVGVAPQKVVASPVTNQHGNFRGGYYPILFDRERSVRQYSLDEKSNIQEAFGGNAFRAMTRHGHTIERTNTGGKPLKLELSGLSEHMSQVVHDLTHRRQVIDVYKLVSDPEIAQAIELAVGSEMYLQLRPWLQAIAGDRARAYSGFTEKLLGRARQGATVVGLGLKVTSAALQSLGYALTTNEIGPKYAAAGLRAAFKDPRKFFKLVGESGFIGQRSGMMRDRMQNYDRDVRDYARKQDAIEGAQASWFIFIGYMDLATSIPTWLGAYRKAMDGALEGVEKGDELKAIDYADKIVRETQAAGAAKDLASIQRGGEAFRLFTMFYSSMSIIFNQFARAGQRYALERNLPQLAATAALIWFLPVVLEAAIRGQEPDDDEGWAKFLAKKVAAYPFGTVVLVRDLVGSLDRYDYSGSPAGEIGVTLRRAALAAGKVFTDEDLTRTDWKAIVNTVGYAARLPTAQAWKTIEYFYDWFTGVEDPGNPATGLYRALVTGKPRS